MENISLNIVLSAIVLMVIVSFVVMILLIVKKTKRKTNISDESYQRYAKFYDNIIPADNDFINKVNKILEMINNGETDVKKIATESNCSDTECILKIRYLRNKRLIDDTCYLDINNMKLMKCSAEDQELLIKYRPFIYGTHSSIDEMATYINKPGFKMITKEERKNYVFNDLKYLDSKNLLNGIKLNEVDKEIIYYTVEKRKPTVGLVTVHCPNCGALNDVDMGNKKRCSYCGTIIIVKETE